MPLWDVGDAALCLVWSTTRPGTLSFSLVPQTSCGLDYCEETVLYRARGRLYRVRVPDHGYTVVANGTRLQGLRAIHGGIEVGHRWELKQAEAEGKKQELYTSLEDEYRRLMNPIRTANAFGVEEIIDPAHTRRMASEWVIHMYVPHVSLSLFFLPCYLCSLPTVALRLTFTQ